MRDPKLAHILVKIILPPNGNTAVSEYRRSFVSPKNGGVGTEGRLYCKNNDTRWPWMISCSVKILYPKMCGRLTVHHNS